MTHHDKSTLTDSVDTVP